MTNCIHFTDRNMATFHQHTGQSVDNAYYSDNNNYPVWEQHFQIQQPSEQTHNCYYDNYQQNYFTSANYQVVSEYLKSNVQAIEPSTSIHTQQCKTKKTAEMLFGNEPSSSFKQSHYLETILSQERGTRLLYDENYKQFNGPLQYSIRQSITNPSKEKMGRANSTQETLKLPNSIITKEQRLDDVSRSKRTRQTYHPGQTLGLEQAFVNSNYLKRDDRKMLSAKHNLTERQVKIWFQNRRMKAKKITKDLSNTSTVTYEIQQPQVQDIKWGLPNTGHNTY